jgi:hypothetical protein
MFVVVVIIQKWWNPPFQVFLGNKTFCHSTDSGIGCCPQTLFSLVKERMIESVQESTPRQSHCIGTTRSAPLPPLLPVVIICSVALVMHNVSLASWLVTGVDLSSVCAVQVGRGGAGGGGIGQCFSTFVRPQPGKFFLHKTRARSQQILLVNTFPAF